MRRIATVMLLALLLALAMTTAAYAVPADATVVSSTQTSVSGAEVASELLKKMDGIALGSESATVTMDVNGSPHHIALDLSELASSGATKSGLGGLAIIAAVAAGLFRGAAMLVRVLR